MQNPHSTGAAAGAGRSARGAAPPPAQLFDALRRAFIARALPILAEMQAAAEAELRRQAESEGGARQDDSLTNLEILRRDAVRHERRWQERVDVAFAQWPRGIAASTRTDGYTLVSEGELQAQLIGQPVIEALERRFSDVLDTIDSRLWSLAASMGGTSRPTNPFAPRVLVEATLATFPVEECDAVLRQLMLRQYERLCGERLGDIYAWINVQLADGGHALAGASDYTLLVAQPAAAGRDPQAGWAGDNALQPRESSWRGHAATPAAQGGETTRGDALRERMRILRGGAGTPADGRRELAEQEFLSVLSLLQGNETPRRQEPAPPDIRRHLRMSMIQGAASLGMGPDTTALAPAQEDAIALVGRLFDALRAGVQLSPQADARLARLAYPYLRLALEDPRMFDAPVHAALALLDELIGLWDGNAGTAEADAELAALADAAADQVANDYHGDARVFDRVLATLSSGLEPLRRRAEIAERRAWQSILGRERLQAARAGADAALASRTEGRPMLAAVAEFLGDQWRQSLVHAWLREGPDSPRFEAALAVGDAMLAIDAAAAEARGNAVADGLIALEQPLRECYIACGLDDSGANALLAALVAELARPDARRAEAAFTPLAGDTEARAAPAPGQRQHEALPAGQVLLQRDDGRVQWLRVAWVSPVSGQHLLVNRQGARQAVLGAEEIRAAIDAGTLVLRGGPSPVQAVLERLLGTPTA
jgi:hypothetical protein